MLLVWYRLKNSMNITKKNKVIIVAPYSPIGSCKYPTLGAAKKIELVIRMLSRLGVRVVLINSAHNPTEFNHTTVKAETIGGVRLIVITLPTLPNRKIGKASNMFIATHFAKRLAKHPVSLVWIYNGYVFESLFALAFLQYQAVPLIVELEDWHTARDRGLSNIKSWIDLFFLKKVLSKAALITCVNQEIMEQLKGLKAPQILFPSLLDAKMIAIRDQYKPFSRQPPYTLGYFGGLTKEKGVNVLFQLADQLPDTWQIVITGSGSLATQCEQAAKKYENSLTFIPNATDDQLYTLMSRCDVIINPHQSIKDMGHGIFPFKVFEALASGRLVISTPLPLCGIKLEQVIMWFDGTIEKLLEKLQQAEAFYRQQQDKLEKIAAQIIREYSEEAMFDKILKEMKRLKFDDAQVVY